MKAGSEGPSAARGVAATAARDKWYQSRFERAELEHGYGSNYTKADNAAGAFEDAQSGGTQVVVEVSSQTVDEFSMDEFLFNMEKRLKDLDSKMELRRAQRGRAREDTRGSFNSTMDATRGESRRREAFKLSCPLCGEDAHRLRDCPIWVRTSLDSDDEDDAADETRGESSTPNDDEGSDTLLGVEDTRGLGEQVFDNTDADLAEQQGLEDSTGGATEEIESEGSDDVQGIVNIPVQEIRQVSLPTVGKLDAWCIDVGRDGITLEELGVKIPTTGRGMAKLVVMIGSTGGRRCGSRMGDGLPHFLVVEAAWKKSGWLQHSLVAQGRGPKERCKAAYSEACSISNEDVAGLGGGECHGLTLWLMAVTSWLALGARTKWLGGFFLWFMVAGL